MKARKKSNLTLNSNSRRKLRQKRFIKSSWPDSMEEAIGGLKPFLPNSPKCVIAVTRSSSKRNGSISPFVLKSSFRRTPSKVPSAKKMRKCLFEDIVSSPEKGSPFKVGRSTEKLKFTAKKLSVPEDHILTSPSMKSAFLETEAETTSITFLAEEKKPPYDIHLFLKAMDKLKQQDLDEVFMEFFQLIVDGIFPLDNMSLLSFADVVRWFSCKSSSHMRYSRQSKLFWKLGYRLLGGRFVHLMSGSKNEGQVVLDQSERGCLKPSDSKINFAVPSIYTLSQFDPYDLKSKVGKDSPRPFAPGVMEEMISTLGKKVKNVSCCLTFDGKKIKQGLTPVCGDVDLFGFESKDSLDTKKHKLASSTNIYQELQKKIRSQHGDKDLADLSINEQDEIKEKLKKAIQTISADIFDVQELRKKKNYAKEKLIERCGDDNWRNSKLAMAISCTIAYIHDIDRYLSTIPEVLNEILCCLTELNHTDSRQSDGERINIHDCENYQSITEAGDVSSETRDTREIRQRTDLWYERRKRAKVSGSTLFTAIGLDGLKKQQDHFDVVMCGNDKSPISGKTAEYLQYGTENEINALATVVGKVLPAFIPGKQCYEEGFVEIEHGADGQPFMVVSPDGSIRCKDNQTEMALEIKCPVMDIQKSLPPRYMLQCQAEIHALEVNALLYICWKPDFSSVFVVKKNTHLYSSAFQIAKSLYGVSAKRAKKLSSDVKELKERIQQACQEEDTVEFIAVVPSLTHDGNTETSWHTAGYKINRLDLLMDTTVKALEDKYELMREKATEAVVFICSTLDRHMTSSSVTAPVCWFAKGNSLDSQTMRNILEHVLDVCSEHGIHIPAISYDGQWHAIAMRDAENQPLTKLQLQKDVWREIENMKKTSILNEIKGMNTQPTWEKEHGVIVAPTFSERRTPTISERVITQRLKDAKIQQRKKGQVTSDSAAEDSLMEQTSKESETTVEKTDIINVEKSVNPQFVLDAEMASILLSMLQTDQISNKNNFWNTKSPTEVISYFQTKESLKSLRDVDLKVVVRFLKRKGQKHMKESDSKRTKIPKLLSLFGLSDGDACESVAAQSIVKKRQRVSPISLKDLAFTEVSKLRKMDLNIVLAEYKWPTRLQEWQDKAYISSTKLYQDRESESCYAQKIDLFYIPAYSKKRKQYEVSCIDSSHLLTRTRRKCCKGGLDNCSNAAWKKVAASGKTNLSTAMVECVIDQMSVATALSHFSEAVECEMRLNGDIHEADLCRDLRHWWKAEDDPGVRASERLKMRLALRKRLIDYVDFSHFPPPGMSVRGWPSQLWEAILANIDAKTLLYNLSKQKTYNTRSFSSLVGETFFSEVALFDRRGQGTVSSTEFEEFIGSAVERLYMRLDDERNFVYRTSNRTVYKLLGDDQSTAIDRNCAVEDDDITMLDHYFDQNDRARVKGKKKEETIDKGRNALQRGSLGVRWEKARRNEGKLLPTVRMGIDQQ